MRFLFLSVSSGLLLSFSWPEIGFFPLSFFAFLPLLFIEKEIDKYNHSNWRLFVLCFISFLIFNVATTYWVAYATFYGGLLAFIFNALLMSLCFVIFHKIKTIFPSNRRYVLLVLLWISFEYLHLHWQLAWPWLTLGNVFAKFPDIIQWYEYTGILGGSLWVLFINVFIFNFIQKRNKSSLIFLLSIIFMPIIISYLINDQHNISNKIEVVIVQPNIDSYNESDFDIDHFLNISEEKLTNNTRFLVSPETMLQGVVNEKYINKNRDIRKLLGLIDKYPNLNILVGAVTQDVRGFKYNSAIFIGNDKDFSIHYKTKLVPGAESIPYPSIFDRFKDFLSVELAGSVGSYSRGKEIRQFNLSDHNITPLICYESIFGDLLTQKDISIISIITNDGWWRDTPGYKQHFHYARLRAIEQRKPVVRSANTGISGFIDQNGNVIHRTQWDQEVAFAVSVSTNNVKTFYNRFGDYIGRISCFLTVLLFCVYFVRIRIRSNYLK